MLIRLRACNFFGCFLCYLFPQQKSPLQSIAGPNNCYLLYLNGADNAQVMMPMTMGVSGIGLKVSGQQPPQSSDTRAHQSPEATSLRAPILVPTSDASDACVPPDGVPTCQSQDKCRPPVAVVVPWNSIASSYANSASLPAGEFPLWLVFSLTEECSSEDYCSYDDSWCVSAFDDVCMRVSWPI